MSITFQSGRNGSELNVANRNFAWIAEMLGTFGLTLNQDVWEVDPNQIIQAIDKFYNHIMGKDCGGSGFYFDYTDQNTCDRIKEFLVPGKCPATDQLVNELAGSGVKVIDCNSVNWEDLGELRDPNSDANYLWNRLLDYCIRLKRIAAEAKHSGDIVRVF